MKLDILAIGVHPDDVELSCSGTILKHISLGKKVGILDLTKGELGTRGNAELRMKEAAKAAKILGVSVRDNLGMKDGFFQNDPVHQMEVIRKIREYQPEIVLCNAIEDRHPDHGRSAKLVSEACFYSGLVKIETLEKGKKQKAWRPKAVYHYIQDRYIKPDFVIDITDFFPKKMEAIKAFASQFYNEKSKEPETPISSRFFLAHIESRMRDLGRNIGVEFAEGFTTERFIGAKNLFDLF
jgi:bacillithiol biosynthesis deacetylase BshB1